MLRTLSVTIGVANMKRILISRETLSQEMLHAANKRLSFKAFIYRLRNDYITQPLENPESLKQLEYYYNTALFMAEEKRNRYSKVAA